jgi:thioredoxin 1
MGIYELCDDDDFVNILNKSNTVYAMVDFYAPWCRPCKKLLPDLEIISEKYSDITFIKINVDEHEEIADKYQITSIPSILVFSTKNIEIEEKITNCSVKEITKLCKKYE